MLISGGHVVLLQHLVLSLSVNRRTIWPFTESDNTRCCNDIILLPENEYSTARNMLRIIM
jgi:hypothetical protein